MLLMAELFKERRSPDTSVTARSNEEGIAVGTPSAAALGGHAPPPAPDRQAEQGRQREADRRRFGDGYADQFEVVELESGEVQRRVRQRGQGELKILVVGNRLDEARGIPVGIDPKHGSGIAGPRGWRSQA